MFTKITTDNGYVYKVDSSEQRVKCAKWAYKTAIAKANYTADTWQKRPNKYAKFVDIYYGDYAKNLLKLFILSNNPELTVIEYDKVRTDDFKNHDLYDLMICDSTIEVKSSLEKYTSDLNRIYNERRIIINVNSPHESLSDFVVQVFFVPSDLKHYESIEDDNKKNPDINDDEVVVKCQNEAKYSLNQTSVYIMGWINKQQEINAITEAKNNSGFDVSNQQSNAKKRTYANVLIKDSNSMDEFIETVKNIQPKNR
ncbi:MAG: hypothetical protein H6598_10130 [Flavobacteriales bacterium]|nr:hypothetical protein [Flavobacteriales bacterium]